MLQIFVAAKARSVVYRKLRDDFIQKIWNSVLTSQNAKFGAFLSSRFKEYPTASKQDDLYRTYCICRLIVEIDIDQAIDKEDIERME